MLIKYSWLAGQPSASILADVVGLITNGLSIATCSSACDKANSAVVANSILSNWTVYDSASGVLSSQNANGSYKYVQILIGTKLSLKAWESWNASTHVGTNQAGGASLSHSASSLSNPSGQTAVATAGTIYIYATSHNLYIDGAFVGEFASLTPALDNTYPRHVIYNMFSTMMYGTATMTGENTPGISRIKNHSGTGDLIGVATKQLPCVPFSTDTSAYSSVVLRTPAEATFFQALPLCIYGQAGLIGKLYELVHLPCNITTSTLDEIQIDGLTYFKIGQPVITAMLTHIVFALKG